VEDTRRVWSPCIAQMRRGCAKIIEQHGWPDTELAGEDGTLAAWLIAQHAIGEPDFQRRALVLIRAKVLEGRVPAAQEAYLSDRIAMQEGRPQRSRHARCAAPRRPASAMAHGRSGRLNERRAEVGLPPVEPIRRSWRRHRSRSPNSRSGREDKRNGYGE